MLILMVFPVQAQVYLDQEATIDERVEDLLSRMTLQEKIGQMTQAERGAVEKSGYEDIKTHFLGSVLSGGGSVPNPNTPDAWVDMVNAMQEKAVSTRLGIPLLYGVDAVHGHNNLVNAVIFPHNIGLGSTRNPDLVSECARITSLEVKASGPNWTFSPCITVPQNELWGRTYEGFSESPTLVDSMSGASVKGYQSVSLFEGDGILACAKHFIGDGGTTNGIDQGNTQISESEMRSVHLVPYYSAIDAGVGSVMASFNSWNGVKCHGNRYLLTDILKEELGFDGFVVGDWNGINQVDRDFKTAVEKSINAGIDMGMQPYNYVKYMGHIAELVDEGKISMERIDDAVRRILRIKIGMGLFENYRVSKAMIDTIGCNTHREVARQAVRESIVLLKNEGLLPLSKTDNSILVAGSKADDIGAMCGGWSITWQGGLGDVTSGTSVREGITNIVGHENVEFTTSSNNIPDADYAVVVVGEDPYAEGAGDIFPRGPNAFKLQVSDQELISAIESKGIPLVVILLSGRPLDITDEILSSDAFMAAWLPGSEGGNGIADLLFGNFKPTGKLSHTWPESFYDVPVNITSDITESNVLFPYGFGLTYEDESTVETREPTGIKIYPNPSNGIATVELPSKQPGVIRVFGTAGNLVKTIGFETDAHIVELEISKPGVYILQINTEQHRYVGKLIIK